MIKVEHLTKYYGSHKAVDDLSFEITEGHVYGFLGPNGAGKSTTMNIITGCLSATEGSVRINGFDIFEEPDAAKRCIGYLPEIPPLYLNETPADYLKFVAEAKGLKGAELKEQIAEAMKRTGIEAVCHRRIKTLSKGYKQRVGIAQALLGNPRVIILDEPTVGLDPRQIIEIRELITELGKTHTVIFSSHILSEVQSVCDRILMIVGGKLVAFGTPDELRSQLTAPNEITVITDASEEKLEQVLAGVEGLLDHEPADAEEGFRAVRVRSRHENIYELSGSLFRAFAEQGCVIYEMALKRGSLEDVFLELSANAMAKDKEVQA